MDIYTKFYLPTVFQIWGKHGVGEVATLGRRVYALLLVYVNFYVNFYQSLILIVD